jgi:hypothetical protein
MNNFLVCENPVCRFILDRRINGEFLDGVQHFLGQCPECGSGWSSTCPFCGVAFTVKFVDGLPQSACCSRRLYPQAHAA